MFKPPYSTLLFSKRVESVIQIHQISFYLHKYLYFYLSRLRIFLVALNLSNSLLLTFHYLGICHSKAFSSSSAVTPASCKSFLATTINEIFLFASLPGDSIFSILPHDGSTVPTVNVASTFVPETFSLDPLMRSVLLLYVLHHSQRESHHVQGATCLLSIVTTQVQSCSHYYHYKYNEDTISHTSTLFKFYQHCIVFS